MKKPKFQITKKYPKWIPPEKRMKRYEDFGIYTQPTTDSVWKKLRWIKFKIIVPTEYDKKELQAAFEYFHDCPNTDTDFIVVNQLVHSYLDEKLEKGAVSPITVNLDLYYYIC